MKKEVKSFKPPGFHGWGYWDIRFSTGTMISKEVVTVNKQKGKKKKKKTGLYLSPVKKEQLRFKGEEKGI